MKTFRLFISLAVLVVGTLISPAAVPSTINYQGRLTDAAGAPLSGNRVMSLKVYDSVTGGAQLYSEILGNVPVDANGIYGFQFGANGSGLSPAISSTLGGAAEHWLEITVDGVAQQPRQKLQAVPFALVAKGLEDGSVTSAMIADGAIGLSKISGLGTAASANAADFVAATNAALAGVPTGPTAAPGTNSSQLATTAFVLANGGSLSNGGSLANVVYAKSYGVMADGVTDDTVALQAAIDAAATVATVAERGTVVLPKGTIRTRRTTAPDTVQDGEWKHSILLKNNVNIVGQGIDVTTIKLLANTLGGTPVVVAKGQSANITLEGFTVSANAALRFGSNPQGEGEGINIKSGENILLHKVKVVDTEQDGFDLDGGDYLRIINCIAEDCMGSGAHIVAEGANDVLIANSIFRRNGYVRRTIEGKGLAGNGAGVDCMMSGAVISGCIFENNVVEVQVFAGNVLLTGCTIQHNPTSLNLAGVVAGWTALPARGFGVLDIRNCTIYGSAAANAIEIIQTWPDTTISDCRIFGKVVCTSGRNLFFNGNEVDPDGGINHALNIVSATGKVMVANNKFVNYFNALRVDTATGGVANGNVFQGPGGSNDIHFTATTGATDNWSVQNNTFTTSSTTAVRIGGGSSGGTFSGNTGGSGGFSILVGSGGASSNNTIMNNLLSGVQVDSGSSTGSLFQNNVITGSITHTGGANFASNTWRRNTGAGCAGVFYGTATLAGGAATVTTPAANSARKFGFSRQALNASTGIGNLTLGTVTAQTSFVINALNDSAATATGDLSSVYWEILE